jgi:hypothetical protein
VLDLDVVRHESTAADDPYDNQRTNFENVCHISPVASFFFNSGKQKPDLVLTSTVYVSLFWCVNINLLNICGKKNF